MIALGKYDIGSVCRRRVPRMKRVSDQITVWDAERITVLRKTFARQTGTARGMSDGLFSRYPVRNVKQRSK